MQVFDANACNLSQAYFDHERYRDSTTTELFSAKIMHIIVRVLTELSKINES